MKNNKEKMNDAVGMLDEETVQDAMTHAADMKVVRLSRRATWRRRAAVLLAACLSLVLMLGALLVIPLMTADDPAATEQTTKDEDLSPLYIEAPMVKLTHLSATEAATVSDPDIPTHESNIQVDSVAYRHRFTILTIDCEPGETVTVNADSDCLYLVDMPLNEDTDLFWGGEFYEAVLHRSSTVLDWDGGRVNSLTFDPTTSCIAVHIPMSSTELDEAILNFSVADGEGTTVGVGSVYIGVQRLVNREEDLHVRGNYTVTRCAVLGSARFTEPSSVTREQADRLVESFVAKADVCKAALDYTPVTKEEKRMAAMAEIILAEFAEGDVGSLGRGHSSWTDYCSFHVESKETGMERNFIVFDNGEWMEFLVHGDCNTYPCHLGCPHSAEQEHHAIVDGCRLTTPDGRIYESQTQTKDGVEVSTLVPVA